MRKQGFMKKIASGVMALAVAFVLMPAINVHAASEYTVTFRPGNVGQFGIASGANGEAKSVKDMAQEVADVYYSQYDATVTEMGAIKVKVPAGADMPMAPGYIIPEEGYCVRSWGPEQGEKVTKNVDYVVDYGRLTDGVEYTVEYVDEESGESVAPFLTTYANVGETVTVNAPATITNSDAGVYELTSAVSQTITLTADASANVITFTYAYSYDPGTVTEEVIVTVPGDTVVTTETITTVVDNGTVVEPGAVVLDGDDQNPDADDDAENQEAEDQDAENQEEEQDIVGIDEEDTPLIDGVEGEEESTVIIEDEEAPLHNLFNEGGSNGVVVLAGVFGVVAVIVAFVWLQSRRKSAGEEQQ